MNARIADAQRRLAAATDPKEKAEIQKEIQAHQAQLQKQQAQPPAAGVQQQGGSVVAGAPQGQQNWNTSFQTNARTYSGPQLIEHCLKLAGVKKMNH